MTQREALIEYCTKHHINIAQLYLPSLYFRELLELESGQRETLTKRVLHAVSYAHNGLGVALWLASRKPLDK